MTGTDLATTTGGEHRGSALVLQADQDRWTPTQIAGLRQLGIENAPEGDLAVFLHVAQRTGLDPFARQIHMIGRNTKTWDPRTRQETWETKYTIQTGIDGYRLTASRAAARNGDELEYEDTQWCGPDGQWTDVWVNAEHPPVAARTVIIKNGRRYSGTAMFAEYVQTYFDKKTQQQVPNSMWVKMPAGQLAKCSEALALRKAYPHDLAALYTDEEMGQADNPAPPPARRGGLGNALANRRGEAPESPLLDMSSDLARRMFATLNELGITDRDDRLRFVSDVLDRDVDTSTQLTDADASAVISAAQDRLERPFVGEPTDPPGDVHDAVVVEDLPDGADQ